MNANAEPIGMTPTEYEARRLAAVAARINEKVTRRPRKDMRTRAQVLKGRRAAKLAGAGTPRSITFKGITYPSISAAARALGVPYSTFTDRIRHKRTPRPPRYIFDCNAATSG